MEGYVKDVISTFGNDERVIIWDIYNEPKNNFLVSLKLPIVLRYALLIRNLLKHSLAPSPTKKLLQEAFIWAREVNPNQPLTAGAYFLLPFLGAKLNAVCLELSDIVSFHSYFGLRDTEKIVTNLGKHERPMICTEYMARSAGSTFEDIMPFFRSKKIGAINWGLVAGKTQTMYSWEDYYPNGEEPSLWFHDILRSDGTPYSQKENVLIQEITRVDMLE